MRPQLTAMCLCLLCPPFALWWLARLAAGYALAALGCLVSLFSDDAALNVWVLAVAAGPGCGLGEYLRGRPWAGGEGSCDRD